jgi:nitronate monooxygenase
MGVLDQLRVPVVLAPLAGGPSTPELAAAVASAGGLGFVAGGYLSTSELGARIARAHTLTDGPLAVNLFAPGLGPADPDTYRSFVERLDEWARGRGLPLGEPRYSDDHWPEKLELLVSERLPVISFTFGCPGKAEIAALRDVGSEVWVTVTSPKEAAEAEHAGADCLVVQGAEAGGHRASFIDRADLPAYSLLPLLALIRRESRLPLVASGGIATGEGLAAVLSAGACAGQIGTGFMLCPEAGTSEVHRTALRTDTPTELTRAFTGRLARGIRNEFITLHSVAAPAAYPELHYVTAPLRARGREQGDADLVNLWAGEAHALAQELPAAQIVDQLAAGSEVALERMAAHYRVERR